MPCREAVDSPVPQSDGTIKRTFIVEGTIDDEQAEGEAYAKADPYYRGLTRTPSPDVRIVARGVWEFTFDYVQEEEGFFQEEPIGDLPTIGTIEIDSSGGTQHVTQCFEQVAFGVNDNNAAVSSSIIAGKMVGFHRDGVNGVDIDVPGTTYTLTKKFLPQAVSGQYLYNLSQMRGRINFYPWTLRWAFGNQLYEIQFQPAELRFLGYSASVSRTAKGLGCWDISFKIHHQANVFDLNIGEGIILPFKGGQHYLWTLYKKKEVAGGTIEVPDLVFHTRVYNWADFGTILGF
jgi:hypothetical protein